MDLLQRRLIKRPSWDEYFMAIAKIASVRSTCSSRPVGCVIVKDNRVLVTGYNGSAPGQAHCTDKNTEHDIFCTRRSKNVPDKDKFLICPSIHAEENAIQRAKKQNIDIKDSTLYCTLAPCIRCIERLADAGISKVYYELKYESVDKERDAQWNERAQELFTVYKQVNLSEESIQKIAGTIMGLSSERLLSSE